MNETYSTLASVDAEEIQAIAEPEKVYKNYILPPATNATLGGVIVGDGLLVDNNGRVSATGQRKTATIQFSEVVYDSPLIDKTIAVYDSGSIVPTGVEIAKFEVTTDGINWIDIKDLYENESSIPYFIANNRVFEDDSAIGMRCVIVIAFPFGKAEWAKLFEEYQILNHRLTYYTD